MANLLLSLDSFSWHDLTINRAIEMDDLILAVDEVDTLEDTIFGHPDAYIPNLGWETVNDIIACSEEEYRLFTGGWFTHDHQKILIKLWRNPTPGDARTLDEMNAEHEFENKNNGYIGCFFEPLPEKMVYNIPSLYQLHQIYTKNNQNLRKTESTYFYQHYKPELLVPINHINDLINRKQVHSSFERLDSPSLSPDGQVLHGEQIGMHFNDKNKSCLYIDGTWKHGIFDIPSTAKDQLEAWGFILPVDQR